MKKLFSIATLLTVSLLTTAAFGYKLRCPNPSKSGEENKKIARRYYVMGMSFQKNGDLLNFIDAFRCVLRIIPYSLSARYKLAEAYDAAGQYSKAVSEYKSVLMSSDDKDLNGRIKKRIKVISLLTDKPMPRDPDSDTSSGELKKQKNREQKALQDELKRKLALLETTKKQNDDYEKKRKALLEDFRKKEKLRMAELEKRIKRLAALEKMAGKTKVIVKYIKSKAKYKTVPNKIRKFGMGLSALGILSGIGSLVSMQLKSYKIGQLQDSLDKANSDYGKLQTSDLSYGAYIPNVWNSTDGPEFEESINTYTSLTIGLGIAAGVFVIGGTILYFIGDSKRVKIDGQIESDSSKKKNSWRVAPVLTTGGAGIAFEAKW